MRAVFQQTGTIPLLQMHDALECSVTSREQGEMIARLGEEAVSLNVPMKVDLKFGKTWGDARAFMGRTDRRGRANQTGAHRAAQRRQASDHPPASARARNSTQARACDSSTRNSTQARDRHPVAATRAGGE